MIIEKLRRSKDYLLVKHSKYFDADWYKKHYNVKGNAVKHYILYGAKSGYNPSANFSRIKYELIYEDVRYTGANPIIHYEKYGCYEDVFEKEVYIGEREHEKLEKIKSNQDKLIAREYSSKLENLIVFLVPENDVVSGGVMSINSIAKVTKSLKDIHDSEVIICTMPNPKTFSKYTKFDSSFNVYRFDQLRSYFSNVKNLMIHIPEIYVYPFLYFITPEQELWLKGIKNVHFNILNQNIEFLPRPRYVDYLKGMSNKVTMTCAHKKYCVPQLRTSFDIDVHFFSTSNFTKYEYVPFEKKEDLLVYSPDIHPMKERILDKIKTDFPSLKMKEIKKMSYAEYLKTIGKAKWMITFGEGLDGYFSESIRSGTMAFSVCNMNFFDDSYDGMVNVFDDYSQMYDNISKLIGKYNNANKFKTVVDKCRQIDAKLYDDNEYIENIRQFYLGNYDYPLREVMKDRKERLKAKPLVSVALASYNGEKYIEKQIKSILQQDYPNLELIVSDDGSTDNTIKILNKYGDKIKVLHNKRHGMLNNFANAMRNCNGEYIALSDQDDIWEPHKITRLVEKIDGFDIIQTGVCVIDENDNYHPKKYMHEAYEIDKTTKYSVHDNIVENTMLGCTTLMNAEFVKKYMVIPKDIIYHDLWFLYNAILNGNGIVYIDEQLVRYRQHGENTAYLTYNSKSWKEKKIMADRYMINSFEGLDNRLKKMFMLDINYNIIRCAMKDYLPNDLEDFLKENYKNMDCRMLIEMSRRLSKDIDKYKILELEKN